jgi:hypothetical protein
MNDIPVPEEITFDITSTVQIERSSKETQKSLEKDLELLQSMVSGTQLTKLDLPVSLKFSENGGEGFDSTVTFSQSVMSFHRELDSFYGAPMTLTRGFVKNVKSAITYRRSIASLGDMRTNLIVSQEGKNIICFPARQMTYDLAARFHELHDPRSPAGTGRIRYALICNRQLQVYADEKLNACPIVYFSNISGLGTGCLGIRMSARPEEILACCSVLEKPYTEIQLVDLSLRLAERDKRSVSLQAYRLPFEWLAEKNLPERVKNFLESQICNTEMSDLPQVSARQAILITLDRLTGLYSARKDEKSLELIKTCHTLLANTPEDELEEIYDFLIEHTHANTYYDESTYVEIPKPTKLMEFDLMFEGTEVRTEGSLVSDALEFPLHPQVSVQILGASSGLNQFLPFIHEEVLKSNLEPKIVEFQFEFPTSCRSVITRSASESQGFARTGNIWNEKYVVSGTYRGLWFFPEESGISKLVNNQLLAETIYGNAKPNRIYFGRVQWRSSLPKIDFEQMSPFLDSFYIHGDQILPRMSFSEPKQLWGTKYSISGIYHQLPRDLLEGVRLHPTHINMGSVREFLQGTSDLMVYITTNGKTGAYVYEVGLNYDVLEADRDPIDNFLKMKGAKKKPVRSDPDLPIEVLPEHPRQSARKTRTSTKVDEKSTNVDSQLSDDSDNGEPRRTNPGPVPDIVNNSYLAEVDGREVRVTLHAASDKPRRAYQFQNLFVGNWNCAPIRALTPAKRWYAVCRAWDRANEEKPIGAYEQMDALWWTSFTELPQPKGYVEARLNASMPTLFKEGLYKHKSPRSGT